MPFTFSHPAIVLPFCNSKSARLSLTGLVIGSIVPDFEFLIRLRETACFGHTLIGIIVFDMPFAILLSFVFHSLIRDTLIQNLPKFLRQRFSTFVSFNWLNYFKRNKRKFFLSVLIGILSHIFLDAFTHYDGAVASRHRFFFNEIVIMKHSFPIYLILQITTSLLGGLYICQVIFKMKQGSDLRGTNISFWYWLNFMLVAIAILAVRLLFDRVFLK